jgi:hypothetical protein
VGLKLFEPLLQLSHPQPKLGVLGYERIEGSAHPRPSPFADTLSTGRADRSELLLEEPQIELPLKDRDAFLNGELHHLTAVDSPAPAPPDPV